MNPRQRPPLRVRTAAARDRLRHRPSRDVRPIGQTAYRSSQHLPILCGEVGLIVVSVTTAFCVGGGMVLSTFMAAPQPVSHLLRPLIAVVLVAVLVGVVAQVFGRTSNFAAGAMSAWLVHPWSNMAAATAALVGVMIVWRLWHQRTPDVQIPVAVGAAVFLVAGALPVIPLISWSTPAHASEPDNPVFLILLDGYPRADTLSSLGVDISGFVDDLEERGFDHYPSATSRYYLTEHTLTYMTTGISPPIDATKRAMRDSWRLPAGFVAVAPPVGSATIPNVPVLNPGGLTMLDVALLRGSLAAPFVGDYVMDGMRSQLDRSLDVLATTNESRVFAHLLAPHIPFLYDGEKPRGMPGCWPDCNPFNPFDMTVNPVEIGGYLEWLNPRLLETVDAIIANHPTAEIVLFSDHGGRFDAENVEEHRRVFFAARTPGRPDLFADSPHPRAVLDLAVR